mmetsp:Transcript_15586/g.25824  ORF Transcript_15586/g.25824 Transcript_15586/m.25824 type:complete len:225 (+) Transcript_15586:176-850(+)|eukprot:CAMPEP_0184665590 /NCGR_PEP_ID=MMETSP0308-20130426/57830_1 /TAXON_ID=38269 /ORGANISM="Gloeochaete witrockiana, Strain SAG 46.84" /LENGTH=224 /DNA_ID=CAMNT_0027109681 /DNA_START=86 /DNA_END=760 /DNA_ORIENTATION=+
MKLLVVSVFLVLSVVPLVYGAATVRDFFVSELFTKRTLATNPWKAAFSTRLTSGYVPFVFTTNRSPWAPLQIFIPSACYTQPPAPFNDCDGFGVINYNQLNVPEYYPQAAAILPGQLNIHPGRNGQYTHIVFTAPVNGSYKIEADVYANHYRMSTDMHLLINNVEWWAADVLGNDGAMFYVPHRISTQVTLKRGAKIDFAVGYGPNQDWDSDWTGARIHIQATF